VFGLHDDGSRWNMGADGPFPEGLTYDVIGWYEDENDDLLAGFWKDWSGLSDRLDQIWKERPGSSPDTRQRDLAQRLEREAARQLGWIWDHGSGPVPQRVVC
jgi:hypothetical protein